jgi:hypothetical protein
MVRPKPPTSQVTCAHGFTTHQLAYGLDSLVRVSRRVGWKASVNILRMQFKDWGILHASVVPAALAR